MAKNKNDKNRTSIVTDNSGNKIEVYSNLEVGDKLRARVTQSSLGDFGASGLTFSYESFKQGEIYEVYKIYSWSWVNVAYVLDEDGCMDWATPDKFEVIS